MQFACWFSSTSFVTMQFQQRCWYSYRSEAEMWFINNLIILFHHKRSTADAIKLYCCSIIAAANSVHFERIFGREHGNFGKAVQPVPPVPFPRNYSSITVPGDNYYRSCFIYFTHVNDDDSSRSSQPRFSNHLLVRRISPIWNIQLFRFENCLKSI